MREGLAVMLRLAWPAGVQVSASSNSGSRRAVSMRANDLASTPRRAVLRASPMKALRIAEPDGPSGLRIEEMEDPTPGRGQLLVEVRAVGLNRADLLQSMGLYPAPPGVAPDVPGME